MRSWEQGPEGALRRLPCRPANLDGVRTFHCFQWQMDNEGEGPGQILWGVQYLLGTVWAEHPMRECATILCPTDQPVMAPDPIPCSSAPQPLGEAKIPGKGVPDPSTL